ncbi:ATP-dependent helicase [Gulosibacter hominis]|uniref:ATP-dependent helicase n=1 Tax=Gulosibacter hominis TaxID=2770504 RepID=UPI001E4B7CD6|nr:ATP-dependent helicase [Gulosibacter hominis]
MADQLREQALPQPPRVVSGAELLAPLNPGQRQAALSLVGPVRILAGPGTGKTRTITHRIAYGVRAGVYDPNRVLALTFTARAAGELRGRLAQLQVPTVSARTFHSAALRQLSYFWPHVVGGQLPQIVPSKSKTIADAAGRLDIRVDPAQVRAIGEQIEWRKVRELTHEQFAEALAAGTQPLPAGLSAEQLVALSEMYERLKDEQRMIDFEDVLLATAGMLETETWVTQQVREQYRFFVVDEYQDVSPLQHKLLRLWLGNRRELCVVGDAAQTIFSFAGASSHYLTDFDREFPDANTVELDENYRSTPAILSTANALAGQISHAVTLVSADAEAETGTVPVLIDYPDSDTEAASIAARIRHLIDGGTAASQIAVLVRTNAQTELFVRAFQQAGIAHHQPGSEPFFRRPEVRAALTGFRAAAVAGDDRPLFQVVSDVLRDRGWSVHRPSGNRELERVWASLDALAQLADRAAPNTSIAEFSAQLQLRAQWQHEPDIDAVTITTMHAAKGLEWDHVFVAGLAERLLPVPQATTPQLLDEERRLLYVALTRARQQLQLSYARTSRPGESSTTSRFVAELGNRIRRGSFGAAGLTETSG